MGLMRGGLGRASLVRLVASVVMGGATGVVADPPPWRVARRVPPPPPNAQLTTAGGFIVGERWGCATFASGVGATWQCWDAGPKPQAWSVPGLTGHAPLQAAPDRICVHERLAQKLRCWQRPRRGDNGLSEVPESWQWLNPHDAPWDSAYTRGDRIGQVYLGGTFACLQTTKDSGVFCRGDDRFGQLGGSSPPGPDAGMKDPAFVRDIWPAQFLAAGTWHACTLAAGFRDDRRVACWGRGDGGQLGVPARETCTVDGRAVACARTPVSGVSSDSMAVLRAGDLFTCLTTREGIRCWGASRDAIFGARGSCPEALRRAWPTLAGPVPAPDAACSARPVPIGGIKVFEPNFMVAPRSLCFHDGGQLRCLGATPLVSGTFAPLLSPGSDASACAFRNDHSLICWGEAYSPPGAPDQPVAIAFAPPPPVGETAVLGSEDPSKWDKRCMIHGGCTTAPLAISTCQSGASATPWSELLAHAGARSGKVVRVSGPLGVGQSFQTVVGCRPDTCCNRTSAPIIIAGAAKPLSLAGLGCRGDESVACCNAPAYGQTVIAEGTLAPEYPDVTGANQAWQLRDAKLCAPPPAP
jgi:hypothetical protein